MAAEVIQTGQGNQTPAPLPEHYENLVSGDPEISIFADHCSPDALARTDSPLSPAFARREAAEPQTTFGGVDLNEKRNIAGSGAGFGELDYFGSDRLRESGRTDDEVSDELQQSDNLGRCGNGGSGSDRDYFRDSGAVASGSLLRMAGQQEQQKEIAPSARLEMPQARAALDAGSHVTATCAKSPEVEPEAITYTISELGAWAIENYTVDPVQNSKNRWRIRIRCRKSGCNHQGHLKLKTVSFMSDSVYKKLTRSKRKYELWKKATIAESAGALRQSD